MAKSKKTEFPYRKSDDNALTQGQQVAKSRYHREVDAAARAILDDLRSTPKDEFEDILQERIDQDSDSAVIYTRDALDIVMYSDSWLAIDDAKDEGIFEWSGIDGTTDAITKIAFYAYRKDLTDQVEAHKSDYLPDDAED